MVGGRARDRALRALPFFVDQDDLDARRVNAVPALGVAIALGLTVWATRRASGAFAPRRPETRCA